MSDTFIIKPRRPLEANLPAHADEGELIITRDTHKIFTGEGPNAPLAQCGGGTDDDLSLTTKTYVDSQDAAEAGLRITGDAATLAAAEAFASSADVSAIGTEVTNRNSAISSAISSEVSRADGAYLHITGGTLTGGLISPVSSVFTDPASTVGAAAVTITKGNASSACLDIVPSSDLTGK